MNSRMAIVLVAGSIASFYGDRINSHRVYYFSMSVWDRGRKLSCPPHAKNLTYLYH